MLDLRDQVTAGCWILRLHIVTQVVSAKERLDAKIEEKRIADLEAEIDAHNPSKKSTKLLSSSSYSNQGLPPV